MVSIVLVLVAIPVFLVWFYRWATKNNDHFRNQPLESMEPNFLFGNTSEMLLRKLAPHELVKKMYNHFPESQVIGAFDFRRPFYILRDPELIKVVCVKEFDHFVDHRGTVDEKMDPLLGNSLVSLKGHSWKEMRSTLSPAFTGSKMRTMFELVSKCGDHFGKHLVRNMKPGEVKVLEMKDLFSKFTNDVIATCAFGIEVDSFENPKNKIFQIGVALQDFASLKGLIKFLGFTFTPWLMRYFKVSLLSSEDQQFFRTTILEAMKIREEKNIVRPDMINLLMTAKKGQLANENTKEKESKLNEFSAVEEHELAEAKNKMEWTDDKLIGQCLIFFLAGFETASTVITFIGYELAINPDVQKKLQDEIDEVNEDLNGKFLNYDKIQKMKYLDMVVSEGLRKWPPAPVTDRNCTKDFDLETDEGVIKIREGDNVWIPIMGIHHDPAYYVNPDKFDPERFSEERKHEINPAVYMPFGVGPRNCIGSRFALMEVKAALYYILLNFDIVVCDKTEIPLSSGAKKFRMLPNQGIWVGLKVRTK